MPISHGRVVDLPSGPQDPPEQPTPYCVECESENVVGPSEAEYNQMKIECQEPNCGYVNRYRID